MGDARFRFLSQEDVVAAGGLDVAATIDVVEEALRLHAEGDTRLPAKSGLLWSDELGSEERDGRIMAMPAYVGGSIALAGLKWIPSVPSNPSRGLPRGIGLIMLTDPETGLPVAVMDGTIVSAARTGAVTGVTARRLARPGAHVAAILGAGVQAGTQLLALDAVLPELDEVRVWDIAHERAEGFLERSDRVVPVASAEEACRGAAVIVAATMAPEPYVPPEWLGPGSLFCSARFPRSTEVACVERADLVVCDLWEHESGHPSRPLARAFAAGVISREEWSSSRTWSRAVIRAEPPAISVFSTPVGLAIEDVAAAARVYRRAEELGLGTELSLWRNPIWT